MWGRSDLSGRINEPKRTGTRHGLAAVADLKLGTQVGCVLFDRAGATTRMAAISLSDKRSLNKVSTSSSRSVSGSSVAVCRRSRK